MILFTRCEFSDRRRPSPASPFCGAVGAVTATSVTTLTSKLTSDDTNVNEANHVVATPILASLCLRHFTLWPPHSHSENHWIC